MENKEGIWMYETHRRATGAPPNTQIPPRLRMISMCEENMQNLVKRANMQKMEKMKK